MCRCDGIRVGGLAMALTLSSLLVAQENSSPRPSLSSQQAIGKLAELGAEIRVDGEQPDQPVWSVDLSGKPVSRETLRLLRAFPQLETLLLNDTEVDDGLLGIVAENPRLKELELAGTRITDDGVAQLAALRSLERLILDRTAVTERGLMALARAPKLEAPSVFDTSIDAAALERWKVAQRRQRASAGQPADSDPSNVPSAGIAATPQPATPQPATPQPEKPASTTTAPADLYALGRQALLAARSPAARRAAVSLLEQALELDPENDDLRTDLADAYALMGEELCLVAAIDLYEDLITRQPESDRLWARTAVAYASLDNSEDAYRCAGARWGQADTPAKRFIVARQYVTIAAMTDDPEGADLFLRQAVVEHGDEPGLRLLWGVVVLPRDRPGAEQIWRPILERYPPPHAYGELVQKMLVQPGAAP